ncbi:MAG: hypothetical protein JNL83_17640 [Myxococcales bacterium]|nr:hypothetical protein [Myxococcales bacterium]
MEAVSVQFALLATSRATGAADLETVSARATAAGHKIVATQTVADAENAVRAQLEAWIGDPQIDVVLVLGGAESDAASRALKPLITEVLPGFTDLFRWLMFQEAGASAMLSSAEAAQCSSTIVFVLPGAIAAAMDKLILPQFDPKTTPRNLVEKLPRLRTEPGVDAVPQPITQEKTQGGSGLPARLPALPSGRMRSRTGANVVHREKGTDDPTKKIDLVQLDRELAASGAKQDETTKTMVPAAPARNDATQVDGDAEYTPAPEDDHTAVTVAAPPAPALAQHPGTIPSLVRSSKPPSRAPETRAETATPVRPVPTVPAVIPPRPASQSSGPSRAATPSVPAREAVRDQARTPYTPLPAVTIQPRNRPPSGEKTAEKAPDRAATPAIAAQRAADEAKAAEARKKALASTSRPEIKVPPADPAQFEEAMTTRRPPVVAEEAKTEVRPPPQKPNVFDEKTVRAPMPANVFDEKTVRAPSNGASDAKTPTPLPAPPPGPPKRVEQEEDDLDRAQTVDGHSAVMTLDSSAAIEPLADDELEEADRPVAAAPVAAAPVAVAPVAGAPVAARPVAAAAVEPAVKRPPTQPPPRPPTQPPPTAATKSPTQQPPVAATKSPTQPPPTAAKRTPTTPPPASTRSTGELPRGAFAYPVQKKRGSSIVLKLFLALILLGTGFGAVVLIFRDKGAGGGAGSGSASDAGSGSGSAAIAAVPPDAAEPAPPPTPDAAEPDIEMDPTPVRPPGDGATKPPITTNPTPTTKPGTTTKPDPVTKPGAGSGSAEKPAGDGSAAATNNDAPVNPPVDADCDETSCILTKYDRACCARYKPKDTSDFKPRVGDVPESLDKSMVRAGVERVKPRVVACGEKSGGTKGTVKIAMQVSPDGAVTSASVADAPSAALGDCVLAAMKSAKFGKTVNGASFTYPFAF